MNARVLVWIESEDRAVATSLCINEESFWYYYYCFCYYYYYYYGCFSGGLALLFMLVCRGGGAKLFAQSMGISIL